MGICQSNQKAPELKLAVEQSRRIERDLKPGTQQTQKLLLLGPGESGKSTVLKQMIILHKNGFSPSELQERKGIIYGNTITPLVTIIKMMDQLGIPLAQTELQTESRLLLGVVDACKEAESMTDDIVNAIKRLWADAGVQQCYERRSEYQLNDSAKYFIESVDRISASDYLPSEQDMLFTRVATIGVVEVSFTTENILFRVFDVGGQKSERRKWIHYFDDVDSIIFIVAISEFNQSLREDETVNRMDDALKLFTDIANNQYFKKTAMILFLNKTDLFREKVQRVSLSCVFPDYTGGLNYDDGVAFLREKFGTLAPEEKAVYAHETCATDTNQVQLVIASVLDAAIQRLMKTSGLE